MGIPGLMTYIAQHSDIYLQNYSLHDTYLVIDGNSLASQLCTHEAKGNCCFGGDYDKYAYCVANFFDDLLKCNITPLIIIDGGVEEKKLSTAYKRTKDRVLTAFNTAPTKQTRSQLFPLLLKEVFKNVAYQKGIRCTQSLFEADDDIASVARLLNCPVLSFDSDFYIFDVMYIPFNTLDTGICRNRNGNGYVKNCKLYTIDFFLQRFPGMTRSVIPLAATLLDILQGYNNYFQDSNLKEDDVFKNIDIFAPQTFEEFIQIIDRLKDHVQVIRDSKKVRLLIIDSLSMPILCCIHDPLKRPYYYSRILCKLNKLTLNNDLAIVITNEMVMQVNMDGKTCLSAAGGQYVADYTSNKLETTKLTNNKFGIRFLKSPIMPELSETFMITEDGIIRAL